jgi:hypothetical protein
MPEEDVLEIEPCPHFPDNLLLEGLPRGALFVPDENVALTVDMVSHWQCRICRTEYEAHVEIEGDGGSQVMVRLESTAWVNLGRCNLGLPSWFFSMHCESAGRHPGVERPRILETRTWSPRGHFRVTTIADVVRRRLFNGGPGGFLALMALEPTLELVQGLERFPRGVKKILSLWGRKIAGNFSRNGPDANRHVIDVKRRVVLAEPLTRA